MLDSLSTRALFAALLLLLAQPSLQAGLRGERLLESAHDAITALFDDTDSTVDIDHAEDEAYYGPDVPIVTDETDFKEDADAEDVVDDIVGDRIVGGWDAVRSQSKHFCMLLHKKPDGNYTSAGCGATLVSKVHLLTAAHCVVETRSITVDAAYCGAYKPWSAGNGGHYAENIQVQKIAYHEEFNNANNEKDIAVITLASPVDTEKLTPIDIATETPSENTVVTMTGLGRKGERNFAKTEVLQQVDAPIIPQSKCNNLLAYRNKITSDMICAGYDQGLKDACQGDSGSSMVETVNGKQAIAGVVSWGSGCAQPGKPGVYANVAYFKDWIRDQACDDSRVDSSTNLCQSSIQPAPPVRRDCSQLQDSTRQFGYGRIKKMRCPRFRKKFKGQLRTNACKNSKAVFTRCRQTCCNAGVSSWQAK